MHSKNGALMCKLFPSSLGPVAMRWFDGLGAGSIDSFKELTRVFGSHFVTCSRVSRPLDSLLSMTMQEGETLKTYSDRYWEIFNKIDKNFDDVAIKNFKVGMLAEHDLRKSLMRKLIKSVHQLIEEDQQQGKGKAKVIPQDMSDFRLDRYNNNRLKETLLGNLGLLLLRWSTQCSASQCIKSWKKLRTSHTLNGQIRWEETL